MVRHYKRKTSRGLADEDDIRAAVFKVVRDGGKIAQITREMNIPRTTLLRYVKKTNDGSLVTYKANFSHRHVFTSRDETELTDYLKTSAKCIMDSHQKIPGVLLTSWQYEMALRIFQSPGITKSKQERTGSLGS